MDSNSILHRFDSARPGRFHLLLMLLNGSCWIWAAFGVTITGFILPLVRTEWDLSSTDLGWMASVSMLGMLAGAILAGIIADRVGRRSTLSGVMLYLGVISILSSFSRNYELLLVLRFFTGMGLGAILPPSGTLVTEFSPSRQRGMMMVLLNGFWGLGGTLAGVIGYTLGLNYGWRSALLFGGLSIFMAPLIHFLLPESLRFYLSKGQTGLAIKQVQKISLQTSTRPFQEASPIIERNKSIADQNDTIWSKGYLRLTLSLWILWMALNFLYQGVFIWLPTLLAGDGSSMSKSFFLTLFISLGQIPGTILVAWLADRIGRRKLIVISLILLALSSIIFSFSQNNLWVMVWGFVLMICNGMAWGLAHPYSAELYPTHLRGRATGWATGVGRAGGVIAPLLIGWMMYYGAGMVIIFCILAIAPMLAAFLTAAMKADTTGRSLEEISS